MISDMGSEMKPKHSVNGESLIKQKSIWDDHFTWRRPDMILFSPDVLCSFCSCIWSFMMIHLCAIFTDAFRHRSEKSNDMGEQ
jgi:hypothetical protein